MLHGQRRWGPILAARAGRTCTRRAGSGCRRGQCGEFGIAETDPAHLERRKAAHDAALKRIAADPKMQATRQAARASSFLGTAKSRLLPASMPFRFFGAAAGFQQVRVAPRDESKAFIRDWAPGVPVTDYVVSASIEAVKPAA